MIFPKLGLLLKMLGIIFLVIVVLIVVSISTGENSSYIALLIPLGFFAFLIFKFRKEGLVSILYFIGGALILSAILNHFLGILQFLDYLTSLIIGIIFSAIAFLLGKFWNVKIFKQPRESLRNTNQICPNCKVNLIYLSTTGKWACPNCGYKK